MLIPKKPRAVANRAIPPRSLVARRRDEKETPSLDPICILQAMVCSRGRAEFVEPSGAGNGNRPGGRSRGRKSVGGPPTENDAPLCRPGPSHWEHDVGSCSPLIFTRDVAANARRRAPNVRQEG